MTTAPAGWSTTTPSSSRGSREAIGEVGGFSATIGGQRLYLLQTAEKGIAWMRLIARGTAGHGSMLQPDNAVTELAEAVARIGRHEWPVRLTPSVEAFLEAACEALGINFSRNDPAAVLAKIGPIARMVGATLTNTANPSMLTAGYKVNVVPQTATAQIDGRFLPGLRGGVLAEFDQLLGAGSRARVREPQDRAGDDVRRCALRRDDPALLQADPGRQGRALLPVGRHGREVVQPSWGSAASASLRCGCRLTLTSPGCSTVWMSGCRSTRWSSALGCSTISSICAEPLRTEFSQLAE